MSNERDTSTSDAAALPGEQSFPCPACGADQSTPRSRTVGGGLSGVHTCHCKWEDQAHGTLLCVAIGICCHLQAQPLDLTGHLNQGRRWERLKRPKPVDWDEVSSCVTSTRPVVPGGHWRQAGWPAVSATHEDLLSTRYRDEHWPAGPNEDAHEWSRRKHMLATVDEIAEWLMLARDRIGYGSGSMLDGTADLYTAGKLISLLGDALSAWEKWRRNRVVDEAARTRRVLAAAAFKWGPEPLMFRTFVEEHLDAGLAQRLDTKGIAVLGCALQLRRRGRPRKNDDEFAAFLKRDCGLSADEEIPDKIEALQRLAATIGVPRLSPSAVEDQVQPMLSRMAQIRREREGAFARLAEATFESTEAALDAYEDADIGALVMEDLAFLSSETRARSSTRQPKGKTARDTNKSRRRP